MCGSYLLLEGQPGTFIAFAAYSGGHSTSTATSADAEVFAEEGTGVPKKKKHKQMKEKVVKF